MSRALVVSAAVALGLTGSVWAEGSGKWLAALYLAGDSDLWQTAQYAASSLASPVRGFDLAVLLDGPPGPASRSRVSVRIGARWRHEDWGRLNTGTAATLRRFTTAALAVSPAARHLLVVLGHGQPPADLTDPWRTAARAGGLGVDWSAGGDCLTPVEVEAALAGQRWDVVVLASCYGMSMEMGWGLRGTGGLLAAAPGVVVLSGADLVNFVAGLDGRPVPVAVARAAAQMLAAGEDGSMAGWAETRGIATLGQLFKELGVAMREDVAGAAAAIEAVRPCVWVWGPGGEIADVGALAQALADGLPTVRGRDAARTLARGASAVVRRVGQPVPSGAEGRFEPAGLGIFLPPLHVKPWHIEPWAEYEREVPFGRASGWAATLKALHGSVAEVVGAGE